MLCTDLSHIDVCEGKKTDRIYDLFCKYLVVYDSISCNVLSLKMTTDENIGSYLNHINYKVFQFSDCVRWHYFNKCWVYKHDVVYDELVKPYFMSGGLS